MRRLTAALACRVQGSRLYGKPLQRLQIAGGVTILDHIIQLIKTLPPVQAIVLGIADGAANEPFKDAARRHAIDWIVGDERDVLRRLIECGERASATDVFRVTTECPFFYFEAVEGAWAQHREKGNDVTTIDGLPEGGHFEIYTMDALRRSHREGTAKHRSEFCSLYIREHRDRFKVDVLPVPPELDRLDLRLTVDQPEDLILCRRVYAEFAAKAPRIPLRDIVAFLDAHPELHELVKPYVVAQRLW